MELKVKIVKAIVLLHASSTDLVYLETELPPTMPKVSGQPPSFKFEVEAGKGIEYVRTVFGMEPEVIRR